MPQDQYFSNGLKIIVCHAVSITTHLLTTSFNVTLQTGSVVRQAIWRYYNRSGVNIIFSQMIGDAATTLTTTPPQIKTRIGMFKFRIHIPQVETTIIRISTSTTPIHHRSRIHTLVQIRSKILIIVRTRTHPTIIRCGSNFFHVNHLWHSNRTSMQGWPKSSTSV